MEEKIDALYDLCETVSKEIIDINEKIHKAGNKLSSGDVEVLDKLTHTLKSVKTTLAMMESENGGGASYAQGGGSYGGSYNRGGYSNGGGYSNEGGSYGYNMPPMMGGYPNGGYSQRRYRR